MKRPQTAIITGASRGIGRTIATLFALKGYNVILNYNHSEAEALFICNALKRRGLKVEAVKADVSDRVQVDSMVGYCISHFGGVDVLVNNAGIAQSKLFTDISVQDWDAMMNTNLKGVFNCSQSVLKYMLQAGKGKIINISSIWGITGASCEVHYSTAKAAVIGMTNALAKELGPSNIQVNCIAPGIIKTDMLNGFSENDLQELKEATPLMRLGKPRDVAACAYYLASRDGDFLTGQVISPNGGFVI